MIVFRDQYQNTCVTGAVGQVPVAAYPAGEIVKIAAPIEQLGAVNRDKYNLEACLPRDNFDLTDQIRLSISAQNISKITYWAGFAVR